MFKFQKAENAVLSALKFPCIVLPKIDGVRGAFLNYSFTGRSGKEFKNRNITETFSNPAFRGFDGELCHGSFTDPELCRNTTGLVNSLHYNTKGELPQLMVFDWITSETYFLPYKKRFDLLNAYVQSLPEHLRRFISTVPEYVICHTIEEVESAHLNNIALGYEGTIVRWIDAPHKNGRSTVRESYFMRIKDFVESEGEIIGYSEAEENLNIATLTPQGYTERSSHKANKIGKGMLGALEILYEEQVINCATGCMTHEERIDYWENPHKLLGKIAKFKHMPYGAKDKPRFAQFTGFRADEDFDTGEL